MHKQAIHQIISVDSFERKEAQLFYNYGLLSYSEGRKTSYLHRILIRAHQRSVKTNQYLLLAG